MSTEGKTVVVLGASMAGIPLTHALLKNTAAKVPGGLKVILVAPNTDLYWCIASVRGIVPDSGLGDEKLFFPIAPGFAKYPAEQFELVQGKATSLDPGSRTVVVQPSDASQPARQIRYDHVVVATGSSAREGMPWKTTDTTEATKAGLAEWRRRIAAAGSIVVAGAGMTGIEVAGELGDAFAKSGVKKITLLVDRDLPLDDSARRDIRQSIITELQKLKVEVLVNKRVTSAKQEEDGTFTVEAGGETIKADLYMPTFGVVPNTQFLPADMLDASGRVKTTTRLRAEGQDDVYVVGDAANLQTATAMHADPQQQFVAKDLHARLVGGAASPADYKPDGTVIFMASVGKGRGVGQMGSFRFPSLMAWFIKGRTLLTQRGPGVVAA